MTDSSSLGPYAPTAVQLEEALERLAASPAFSHTDGMIALLRFLLESSEKHPEGLKEVLVGVAFYNRVPAYNPRHDSIVRVNVRRLRQRLDFYYETTGASDPVRFDLPSGAYRVSVQWVGVQDAVTSEASVPAVLPAHSRAGVFSAAGFTLLALLVVAAIFVTRASPRSPYPVMLQSVPLTMGGETEFEPATTRDGRQLAYVAKPSGAKDYRILLRPFAAVDRSATVLDTGPGDAFFPAWSPDAKQIAFLRCADGPCEIATIAAGGDPVRVVRVLPTYERPVDQPSYQYRQLNPVWTRDGKSIIYPFRSDTDSSERLVQQTLATGAVRTLTSGDIGDEDDAPALSFDGQSVAFLRRHLAENRVMVLDLRSLRVRTLMAQSRGPFSGLTWAPHDSGVFVSLAQSTGSVIEGIPLRGTPQVLDIPMPFLMNPAIAGDGRHLMFLGANRSRNLVEAAGNAPPVLIFPSKQRNSFSAASPDGRRLAFVSNISGRYEVWLLDRKGRQWSGARQLTMGLEYYPSSLTWSPDGRYIGVGISNTSDLEIVDVATGAFSPLRLPGLEHTVIWSPQWSADGRWIYMAAWGEKRGIFRAATGPVPAVEQVYGGSAREIRLDAGHDLYFGPNYGNGIFRLPLSSNGLAAGPPSPVPGLEHLVTGRAWLVENHHLLYIDERDSRHPLESLDLQTRNTSRMTGPLERVAYTDGTISFFPVGRCLVFSQWAEAASTQIFSLPMPK